MSNKNFEILSEISLQRSNFFIYIVNFRVAKQGQDLVENFPVILVEGIGREKILKLDFRIEILGNILRFWKFGL